MAAASNTHGSSSWLTNKLEAIAMRFSASKPWLLYWLG